MFLFWILLRRSSSNIVYIHFFLGVLFPLLRKRVTCCIEYYHRSIVLFKGMAMSVFQFTIGIALNFEDTWEMTQCSCCTSCAGHTNYFEPQKKHL